MKRWCAAGLSLCLLSTVGRSHAQDDDETADDEALTDDEGLADDELSDETLDEDPSADDAFEELDAPDPDYGEEAEAPKDEDFEWFLGFRFRHFILPEAIIRWFVDGGTTISAFTGGPELSLRPKGWDVALSITTPFADWSTDETLYKGFDEPDTNYEKVKSDLKAFYFTADILKDIPLDEEERYSFLVGGGIGFGILFGDLSRSQVYPDDPNNIDPDDVDSWNECTQAGDGNNDPVTGDRYCDDSNDRYAGYVEPGWANGGHQPLIVPYAAIPHIAFRAEPIRQLAFRVDAAWAVTSFFYGFSAAYRLP